MVIQQLLECGGVEQRHVRRGDEHSARKRPLLPELLHRALHSTSRTRDLILFHNEHSVIIGAGRFGHSLCLITHDNGERLGIERPDRIHDPVEEGLSCEFVQHFRFAGTHARPLPCCEDDCRGQRHGMPPNL